MEKRKIVVIETKTQKKSVIMSSASTLAELKHDFNEAGIDYTGMTFYEGVSKTELRFDDSILPHDVPYKGHTTNELVFMLTNVNKKIKSGNVDRKEIYRRIKENNLQANCVAVYGKNFTRCTTGELIHILEMNPIANRVAVEGPTPGKVINPLKAEKSNSIKKTCSLENIKNSIIELCNLLIKHGSIYAEDATKIKQMLYTEELSSSYSEEELDAMISEALD